MDNKEEILKQLNSNTPEEVDDAVSIIKTRGDLSIVPSLLDVLISNKDHHTTTAIFNLLADIKDHTFKDILIQRILSAPDTNSKSLLLRICWESSLDYSDYTDIFIRMVIEEEFIIALEASTILENIPHLTEEKYHQIINTLKGATVSEEKRSFINQLSDQLTYPQDNNN